MSAILPSTTFLFDLETSGLHRTKDQIISIGCLYLKEHTIQKSSRLLLSLEEEKEALTEFLSWCQAYDTIVTFRGKGFDYPFLLERLRFHQLPCDPFLRLKLIDMEKQLKGFSSNRQLLEQQLGITRKSTSTGQDIAHLYRTYLACKNPLYEKLILVHQEDELLGLYGIWELYQMLYHLKSATVLDQKQSDSRLIIHFGYPENFQHDFHESAYGLQFDYEKNNNRLQLIVPLYTGALRRPLMPVKDYYYIPAQKQLIHKSLAAFLPADQKRKARKDECFITETHTFLKLFTTRGVLASLWYDEAKNHYIIYEASCSFLLAQQIFSLFFQHSQKSS